MSVPQMPQWVTRISMSVSVKGFGSNAVNVRGLLASCATQPWKVLAGGVEGEVIVSWLVVTVQLTVRGCCTV